MSARNRGGVARRIVAAAILLGAIVAVAVSGAPPAPRPVSRAAYPDTFPAGDGRAIAERACLFCHSPMLVTQQAKDSTGWEKTLATMTKWGAPMTPAEHDTLRGYLLARFGPRKTP